MNEKTLSDLVFERFSLYNRCIKNLSDKTDKKYTDSSELSRLLKIDSSLIRRDLSLIGKMGKRGMGYSLEALKQGIEEFMAKRKEWVVGLVGIGNLGIAIYRYLTKVESNYSTIKLFDRDSRKIGKDIDGRVVEDISNLKSDKKIEIGIITVPAGEAQEVADTLIKHKALAILNFAPIKLSIPGNIYYREIDVIRELDILSGMISYYSDNEIK